MYIGTNLNTNLQSYYYNRETGKISLSDGNQDAFCRYYNDEELLDGDLITNADARQKQDIKESILEAEKSNYNMQNDSNVLELDFTFYDPFRTSVRFGDYIEYHNQCLSDLNEFKTESDGLKTKYSYLKDIVYNTIDNGISLIPGKEYDFGDRKLTIKEDGIYITDKHGKELNWTEGDISVSQVMDLFIRCANDQLTTSSFYMKEMNDIILRILNKLSIDVDRNFTINEKEFTVIEGTIRGVDELDDPLSYLGLTKYQQSLALQKYGQSLLGSYVLEKTVTT